MSEEEEALAWRLRQYRERAGMKQSEAAKVLGLDATAITKIEHGERGVSAMELLALAKAYHVNVGILLGEETGHLTPEDIRRLAFAGFVASGALELEQRVSEMAERQTEMEQHLAETQRLIDQFKRKQIKAGPLGPLAEVLAYHHKMVNGWAYLASKEITVEDLERLHTEFVKMRDVVIHYEYTAQHLLGINPSPLADLEV